MLSARLGECIGCGGVVFILSKLSLCYTNTVISRPQCLVSDAPHHLTTSHCDLTTIFGFSDERPSRKLKIPSYLFIVFQFVLYCNLQKNQNDFVQLLCLYHFQVLCWNEAENWLSVSGCDKNIWWDLHWNSLTEWICVKYSSPNLRFTHTLTQT